MASAQSRRAETSPVVTGLQNLYVGRVTEVITPDVKPFEEVQDQVRDDVIQFKKNEPEYRETVTALAEQIDEAGVSLDEIPTQFAELADATIGTLAPFKVSEFQFPDELYWDMRSLITDFKAAEPGDLIGPVQDMIAKTYFIELVSLTPPTDEGMGTGLAGHARSDGPGQSLHGSKPGTERLHRLPREARL